MLGWVESSEGVWVVAMGAVRGQEAALQVAMVCLDELMPEDCRYRRLDRVIDWSFVREAAGPYYADEVGRPSRRRVLLGRHPRGAGAPWASLADRGAALRPAPQLGEHTEEVLAELDLLPV